MGIFHHMTHVDMTDVTSLSSMPTGHGHVLLLHLHTSLLPDIL